MNHSRIVVTALAFIGIAVGYAGADEPADAPRPGASAFAELPLGAVKPRGWLKSQLKTQAEGLGGHLDEFWPDIKDSAWIGGKAEGWERTPYWLDGVVPLAYLLDDGRLKAKVKTCVDYILDHQAKDGWMGPVGDNDPKHKPYDVWPLFVLFKALTQYQEATGDPRVIPALLRCSKKIDAVITGRPLESWGHFRGADLVVSLYWLHDRTRDPSLLALADKVLKQSYDWRSHFEHFDRHHEKATTFTLDNHGVNNGMGLKFAGVRFARSGDPKDRAGIFDMLEQLDRYHGQATGIFTCDEHYAGRSPSQGTELCTVAEAMYSLELMEALTGDAALGDRLEKIAYNAFPATFKKDMTAHQYDQQANQVVCQLSEPRVYTNNGPDANLYGLEPNFGCCTANMHQGWPKLASHLWAKSPDGGLAAMVYAPCVVETTVRGKAVKVETVTDYPFRNTVTVKVTVPEPMTLPIRLRVPHWCTGPAVRVGSGPFLGLKPGTFARVGPAEWTAGTHEILLRLPMSLSVYRGWDGAIAVGSGPLVFALKVDAEWKKLRGTEPYADYEVRPKSPWNYALDVDPKDPLAAFRWEERPVGAHPFTPEGAPVLAKVMGRRLPRWTLEKNAAAPPPKGPVTSQEPPEELTLIPYGCTDLRVTEFPVLRRTPE